MTWWPELFSFLLDFSLLTDMVFAHSSQSKKQKFPVQTPVNRKSKLVSYVLEFEVSILLNKMLYLVLLYSIVCFSTFLWCLMAVNWYRRSFSSWLSYSILQSPYLLTSIYTPHLCIWGVPGCLAMVSRKNVMALCTSFIPTQRRTSSRKLRVKGWLCLRHA